MGALPPPPARPQMPPPPQPDAPAEAATPGVSTGPDAPAQAATREVASAERVSRGPLVAGLLLVVALAGVVVAIGVWITKPAVCDETNVRSERFGYCLMAPAGWRVAEVEGERVPFDQLFRPASAATLTIQAVDTRRDLDAFVSDLREMQREAGLEQEDIRNAEVGGVRARQWDSQSETPAGSFRIRDVVFVREGVAWRVQFADAADEFEESARDLGRMLESWRFA